MSELNFSDHLGVFADKSFISCINKWQILHIEDHIYYYQEPQSFERAGLLGDRK